MIPSYQQASLLTRRRTFFETARMLHQSHILQKAQKPSTSPTKTFAPTASTPTSSDKTHLTSTNTSETELTDSSKPNKSLGDRAKELWKTAKYLFKFYFNGVKQIWANRTQVKVVQARVASGGSGLTREESQLIQVHNADMRKLPLFLFILLILEEALPLVVIWAPSLLPSTCILPTQLTKIRLGEEVKRANAVEALRESEAVKKLLPVVQVTSNKDRGDGGGGLKIAAAHADASEDVFSSLSSEELAKLAKMFSLSTWGGSGMIRRRLDLHMSYIRNDDALMCPRDGSVSSIPQNANALAKACGERGLRCSAIDHKEMFESLRTWLRYTTKNPNTKALSDHSIALLPLQLYNPAQLEQVKGELEAESQRGLVEKTKDVLREVVEEENKILGRDERVKAHVQAKKQQQP
nr:conserved hypothetical protein [Melanopsichium pennsylvanicum 4]